MSATTPTTRDQGIPEYAGEIGLPAWPVLVLLWGFPLWWVTGTTVIMAGILTVVMISYLVIGRTLPVLPGMAALAAFLVWVFACISMIDSGERLLGYFYRVTILIFVATAFVYTLRSAGQLTRRRIISALTFIWFFIIVCGLAALVIPEVRLTTPVGLMLPDGLRDNSYVQDLFFPPMAEIQRPFGSPQTFIRPAAPFPYANSWGVAIVLLSPVAVACFLQARHVLLRVAILVGFVAMIPPSIATGNRGMFGALAISGTYVVIRMAVRNRAAPGAEPGHPGSGRCRGVDRLRDCWNASRPASSTATRSEPEPRCTSRRSQRTMESPLLGYGAPRPSQLQDISLGTQGYVWMLMFSYGFVGLALFLTFLWGTTLRTWRVPGDVDLVLHSMLVAASVVIVVYGLDIMQLLTIMLVAAVLVRRRHGLEPDDPDDPDELVDLGLTAARG